MIKVLIFLIIVFLITLTPFYQNQVVPEINQFEDFIAEMLLSQPKEITPSPPPPADVPHPHKTLEVKKEQEPPPTISQDPSALTGFMNAPLTDQK